MIFVVRMMIVYLDGAEVKCDSPVIMKLCRRKEI